MEWWKEKGREAYNVLGECTTLALENENSEMAVICGYPLLKLAETENANYFGTEGTFNYNSAHFIAKEVIELSKEKGVPSWFNHEIAEMEKILKDGGWI